MGHAIDATEQTATTRSRGLRAWLDERLGLKAFDQKYGRKAFPVHSTYFLGEMALFSFVILILTGIYLGFVYVPSNADVTINGETVPQAYASVQLIESIQVGNLFRNVHHWASQLMIASIVLHLVRIYFTGTYRKPREVNWMIGIVLLGLSLMAGFVGYSLPYDAFAVTATGIGFSIARSIPWVGGVASELFFGGTFPTLGSIPRLYTIHVFILPAIISLVIGLHLLIILKQKHTQPGYARPLAEPGKVLGVPALPYQGLLAVQLLMLMFGALFLLSAFIPPHPLSDYGPPGPTTPEVKPDWYLLWIYGFLKIVPSWADFTILGGHIGSNFIGGLLFPALVFGVLTFTPLLDRTNRRAIRRFEYLEPPRQGPVRLAAGFGVLTFLSSMFLAAYYDTLGLSLGQIWAIVIIVPIVVAIVVYFFARSRPPAEEIDPREELPEDLTAPVAARPTDRLGVSQSARGAVAQDRAGSASGMEGAEARDAVVAALRQAGDLADAVERQQGQELLATLENVETIRISLAQSNQALQGSIENEEHPREPK
jgi:cytochrome b-561